MNTTRRPLVAGNWKMNGTLASVRALCEALRGGVEPGAAAEVAVFPPACYLAEVQGSLSGSPVRWGAQNVSEHGPGAFTGEIAAPMLGDFGCHYVLVGHSERRTLFAESDDVVAAKLDAALTGGLVPVLCLGETLAEREAGATETVVARQLASACGRVGIARMATVVIAYEPVWAIGTGRTATPEQAQAVHAFLRSQLAAQNATIAVSARILYGGSVKAAGAPDLFSMPDIDGGLVGGASLDANEFLAIAAAVRQGR